MRISVIVSTYTKKRINDILSCFDSLSTQTLKPYEVLLVLDPDSDLIEFYKLKVPEFVKIIVSSEKGLSNARNEGVRNSAGEVVAFIDDDAYADQRWLEHIASNYSDPEVNGVGGKIIPIFESVNPVWFPEEFYWTVGCSYEAHQEKRPVRNSIGCNMSFRRLVFENIGYFRSDIGRYGKRLLAGEEAEFSLRLLSQMPGSKIILDPSAIVYHRVPQSRLKIGYLTRRAYYEGVSKGLITTSSISSNAALDTERGYLKHLMLNFLPGKFLRLYTYKGASQLVVSCMLISAVFLGYISARVTSLVDKVLSK